MGEGQLALKSNVEFGAAFVNLATLRSAGNGAYITTADGRRPGGSECGDYAIMTGFKEVLTFTSNSVTLTKSFRCWGKKEVLIMQCSNLQ